MSSEITSMLCNKVLQDHEHFNNTTSAWTTDKSLTLTYKGTNPASVKNIQYSYTMEGGGGGGGEVNSLNPKITFTHKSSSTVFGTERYPNTFLPENPTATITVKWNGQLDEINLRLQ